MSTFYRFPRLPFELREIIWEMAIEPRTVEIRSKCFGNGDDDYVLYSPTPSPAVLHTCQESRKRGLQTYQKCFQRVLPPEDVARYFWINFDMDTVFVGSRTSFLQLASVAPLIKHLKFEREYGNTYSGEYFYHWGIEDLRIFKNLDDVHVVCANGRGSWWGMEEVHGSCFSCGVENVYLIDPEDGSILTALELDELCERELQETIKKEDEDV